MTTRSEAIVLCKTFADAYEDYPFDEANWTAMRHIKNRKTFAFIYDWNGNIWINAKCEPLRGDFLKTIYPAVMPAYHMNKVHWIGIRLDGSMSDGEILDILSESHRLTQK